MNFLTPEALAFATTLPVVVVFYLLKRRRVAQLVSSTVLWQRFLNETQASSPFQKLRHNWLLVIQLILLALAVFALTRPYFAGKLESGRFIVAILDVSASMQATDVSPSRLGQAKADLAKLIDSMYDNDRMVLLLAGAVTEVRQSPTSAKSASAFRAWPSARATDSPTRLLDAIKLAQNLTRNRAKTEVHLFSDGASPDLDEFELQDLNLAYHRVGEGGDNLGIVSLEVRPHPEQAGQQAVFATFANASSNALTNDVSLFFGGRLVGNRRVSVGATNTASLVFVASQGTNGVFRLQLRNNDVLAVDNTASVLSLTRRNTRALLVTKGNQFLERALRSVPKLDLAVLANLNEPIAAGRFRRARRRRAKRLAKWQRSGNSHTVDQLVPSQRLDRRTADCGLEEYPPTAALRQFRQRAGGQVARRQAAVVVGAARRVAVRAARGCGRKQRPARRVDWLQPARQHVAPARLVSRFHRQRRRLA